MEERTLADFWFALYKRKKSIFVIIITAILSAVYFSYTLEKVYEAKTVFFVPNKIDTFAFYAGELNPSILTPPVPIPDPNINAVYVGILRSMSVARRVHKKVPQKSIKALLKDVDFVVSNEFLLQVYVKDNDPKVAADVVNAYPICFNEMFKQFFANPTLKRKINVEQKIKETEPKVLKSNKDLENFRKRYKTVSLREDISQLIADSAQIQTKIIDARAAIASAESYPDKVKWRNRLIEYTKEKQRIDDRRLQITKIISQEDEIAQAVNRYRNMLKSLYIQLDEIKAQDEREMQNVVVIDPGVPPKKPVFPILWLNVVISGIGGLIGGVFFAFFMDYVDRVTKKRRFEAIEGAEKI